MSRTAEGRRGGTAGSASVTRVVADAARLGLALEPVRLSEGTRTAGDAARACGCGVDRIVKSIVFRVARSGRHVLSLTTGGGRVDPRKAAALVGAPLEKADAASVRTHTGGGVAPLGHVRPIATFLDPRILDFEMVWAAAGTPNHVFAIDPRDLQAALQPCRRLRGLTRTTTWLQGELPELPFRRKVTSCDGVCA